MRIEEPELPPLPESGKVYHQFVFAERGSKAYAVLHGDMHIRDGHPIYQIEELPAKLRPSPSDTPNNQPSRLLNARVQTVAFTGRERELEQLISWRDRPRPGISVLLMHGPAGQGKTRLAAEFATISSKHNWTVWTAHHITEPSDLAVSAPGSPGSALLLVVDYAERWPVDDLLLLLQNPILQYPERARILLIARSSHIWWPALRHRLTKMGHDVNETLPLGPLAESPVVREQAFRVAFIAFAKEYGVHHNTINVPNMQDDNYNTVLTIHMSALAAVDALKYGESQPIDVANLSTYLLDREQDYWQSLYDHDREVDTPPLAMGRITYLATLTTTMARDTAMTLLERLSISKDANPHTLIADHAKVYPPQVSTADTVLEPLQPDRLGEDYIALTTPGHAHPDHAADGWAANIVHQLFEGPNSSRSSRHAAWPSYTRSVIMALIETSRRWDHLAKGQLIPLLRAQPRLAFEAGGLALSSLVELEALDSRTLEAIYEQRPESSNFDLDVGLAVLAKRHATELLRLPLDSRQKAEILSNLGVHLMRGGLYDEALTATQQAVDLSRTLGNLLSSEVTSLQARCLFNHGRTLMDLGRQEESVITLVRAKALYEKLEHDNPTRYKSEVRLVHNALSFLLWRLGRQDEAMALLQSVPRSRDNRSRPDPDEASLMAMLGLFLGDQGRYGEAIEATEAAVEHYRKLVTTDRMAYAPQLATNLSNLGIWQWERGNVAGGFGPTLEAVELRREFVRANAAPWSAALADSLTNLGICFGLLERYEEALGVTEEATSIRRKLVRSNPLSHEFMLAVSLHDLSGRLSELGEYREALKVASEALGIFRRRAAANPGAVAPNLAASLGSVAQLLYRMDRFSEASKLCDEALAASDSITSSENPASMRLRAHLLELRARLSHLLGEPANGLGAMKEATQVARDLSKYDSHAYGASFVHSLDTLALLLVAEGDVEKSLKVLAEARAVQASLKGLEVRQHEISITAILQAAALGFSHAGQHNRAIELINEATALWRVCRADSTGTIHTQGLARALNASADIYCHARRYNESLTASQEAIEIARTEGLNWDSSQRGLPDFLRTFGHTLGHAERWNEAAVAIEESVRVFEGMGDAYDRLLSSLLEFSRVYTGLGNNDDALSALARVVKLAGRKRVHNHSIKEIQSEALEQMAWLYLEAGRNGRALESFRESIKILRTLTRPTRSKDELALARALARYADFLLKADRSGQVVDAAQQCLELCNRLTAANCECHATTARAWWLIGYGQDVQGNFEEARAAVTRAVAISREVSAEDPEEEPPLLASSLNLLGNILAQLGSLKPALEACEEGLHIRRRLAANGEEAARADLAQSLWDAGARLAAMERTKDALKLTAESASIFRQLANESPTRDNLAGLAGTLSNLGANLWKSGKARKARKYLEEAVAIRRKLAVINKHKYLAGLAESLTNYGACLSSLNMRRDSLGVTKEAVQHYRQLVRQSPRHYEGSLGIALINLASELSDPSELESALAAAREATSIFDRLIRQAPALYSGNRKKSYRLTGQILSALGRSGEAEKLRLKI